MSNSSSAKNIVLGVDEWNTSSIKYMAPKVNDKGMISISIISKQTNRALHISTPLMMTWGVSDFVDEKGESDGKFSISLNFPNEEYKNESTDKFLQKLKDFENEIYDTKSNLIFPSENEHLTPVDFIPKMSSVACVLRCSGIWIGGKGWGLSWKLVQCVVKPRVIQSVYGTCHIKLSNEDRNILDSQVITEEDNEETFVDTKPKSKIAAIINTQVDNSDDEAEVIVRKTESTPPVVASVPEPEQITVPETEPIVEEVQIQKPIAPAVPLPVKKIIKKKPV